MTTSPNPRRNPSPSERRPPYPNLPPAPPTSARIRRYQLVTAPRCQWQARAVRCVAEAVSVVRSREGVLRSTCEQCLPRWLRTGAQRV